MKILEITEANASLAEYTSGLTEEPIVITSNGQPIAALVMLENVDMETIALSTNPKFLQLIDSVQARRHSEGGISSAEMRRRLGNQRQS